MPQPTARTRHQFVFAVLAVGILAFSLLQSLLTPVLVTVQEELHTSRSTVTWVLTAYLLSASVFTPIMGRAGDILGRKPVFVATLVALSLGALLAALAWNVAVLIAARVIQGVGGGVLPLAFGVLRDELPPEKVSRAVGAIASLTAVGAGAGVVLAGPIVNTLDYHWLFWIPMALTAVAAVAAHLVIPTSSLRTPGRVSPLPALLLSAWLVALLVALSRAPGWGWASGKTIGLLLCAVVIAASWVHVEKRSAAPLVDMQMMRLPAVWTNNLVGLLMGVSMYALFAFVPQFVQTPRSSGYGFGAGVTQSGLILLPLTVLMFLGGMVSGGMTARIGGRAVIACGLLTSLLAVAVLTFAHSEKWELYVATGLLGGGFGLAFAAMSSLIVGAVPPDQTGVASGMNTNIRTVGGSIGAALMTSVVTTDLAPTGLPRESGYTHGFGMLGGALLIAVLAVLLMPRPSRDSGTHVPAPRSSPPVEGAPAPTTPAS
ncbi:MFS transporter [Streptomyces sp. T12]|uniref:MFS transporter n=1 Tax=unclassified Streptomyces TaxID=2593676 RepID=UPI0011A71943|nr:MFS transporter [Streptomyces sp. T12]TWD17448.1 MFS transporter [Streptomyces sp. T12]